MLLGEIAGRRRRRNDMADREHWFEDLASHMKAAYLRYSFTKGTVQEVDYILEATRATVGSFFIDVGCGPGRHSLELARRGMHVRGIDVSQDFVDIAQQDAATQNFCASMLVPCRLNHHFMTISISQFVYARGRSA